MIAARPAAGVPRSTIRRADVSLALDRGSWRAYWQIETTTAPGGISAGADRVGRCVDSATDDRAEIAGTRAGHAGAGMRVTGVVPALQAAWASAASIAPNATSGPRKFFDLMAVPPERYVTSTTRTAGSRARLHRGPRPAAAGTGGPGWFLARDDPLGVLVAGSPAGERDQGPAESGTRPADPHRNGSRPPADEHPQLHKALPPRLSHPRSACRWLRSDGGTGQSAEQEVLAVRGLEGGLEFGDFFALTSLELGELAGERGDDVAGVVWSCVTALGCAGMRPGTELLDALPDGGVAVEEVQRHGGGGGQAAEGDRLPGAEHVIECRFGAGGGGGGAGGCGFFQAGQVAR